MKLIHVYQGHSLWPATTLFIRTTYLEYYAARIGELPKNIIALVDAQNKVHCAAGLRDASEPYFSEYYLDAPIERVISGIAGKAVERREIVEVSSLTSRTSAASIQFMRDLILYGDTLGFNWAFFTATSRLEKLLRRIHLPLIDLGMASPARIPNPEIWGTYYDAK
ncbi:MAG: thermostable hemolysin, partial [Alphaproteobacteria bacterium]